MADEARYVIPFTDPDASRIEVAGSKAGRLADLLAAGFPVPEGVVLTTAAFERFVATRGLGHDSSPDAVMRCELPDDLREALAQGLSQLGDAPLAVRSSGVAEDLAGASYAGQYETVLDVRGQAAVEEAVRYCWASAFSERVQAYAGRGQAGMPSMALLIQRLVPAEAAGVAFTANPVTGNLAETLVSAVRGLGDRLASGTASPDEWVVRDGRAEARSSPEGAVNSGQVLAVTEMARRIEAHFGSPQDVEWAAIGPELYLLQARPITGLPETRREVASPMAVAALASDYGGHWLRRDQAPEGYWVQNEHWPNPVTSLYADFGLVRHIAPGFRAAFEAVSNPLTYRRFVVVDGYVYIGQPSGLEPPSSAQWVAFEEKVATHDPAGLLRRWWAEERPIAVATLQRVQEQDLSTISDQDLAAQIAEMDRHQAAAYAGHFIHVLVGANLIVYRFAKFCQEQMALPDAEILELLAGASGASSRAAAWLEGLAAQAISRPSLRAKLQEPEPWTSPEVRELLQSYLEEYGYRSTEFEYSVPTLIERPGRAVQLLREALARLEAKRGGAAEAALQRAEARIAELRGRLSDGAARAEFDGLLREARDAYGVRDDDNGVAMWGGGLMRRALLDAARRLVERGLLPDADLVWFVRRQELEEALAGSPAADLGRRAEARQAEFRRQQAVEPPPSLGTRASPPTLPPLSEAARQLLQAQAWARAAMTASVGQPQELGARELRGLGVSRGTYRGIARVVRAVKELERVEPGDVLICPYTSPAWTTVFARIGALVADNGGVLSHPAILAREFGLPAVVGTGLATKRIPDGAMVEVDGQAGSVRWD